MMLVQLLLVALALPFARAGCCPNACSGHGTCGIDDLCTCYPNWQNGEDNVEAGDCGSRQCPFELAWSDSPNIDGRHHRYAECANKGLCDRTTGECVCFDGYEGKACQRQACYKGCSGHGRCQFADELAFGDAIGDSYVGTTQTSTTSQYHTGSTNFDDAVTHSYKNWDNQKSMACNCDGGWRGADCSLRSCPEGNDVMVEPSGGTAAPQIQALCFFGTYADNEYFALTFTTQAGERYTTNPIVTSGRTGGIGDLDTLEALVKARLEALPNGVIDTVNVQAKELDKVTSLSAVVVNAATDCQLIIEVEFAGPHVSGNQNLLEVEYTKCDVEGCTPRIPTALAVDDGTTSFGFVSQVVSSNEESYECGGRGKCDTLTGTCQCFSGYYGWHCETQTALI